MTRANYSCQDGDSSSCPSTPWQEELKEPSWQPWWKYSLLATKTLDCSEPRVSGKGSTNSPNGSVGVKENGSTPTCTSWFLGLCILPPGETAPYKGHLFRMSPALHVTACHLHKVLALSWLFYQASGFWVWRYVMWTVDLTVLCLFQHFFNVKWVPLCDTVVCGILGWRIKHSICAWIMVLDEGWQAGKANPHLEYTSILGKG